VKLDSKTVIVDRRASRRTCIPVLELGGRSWVGPLLLECLDGHTPAERAPVDDEDPTAQL